MEHSMMEQDSSFQRSTLGSGFFYVLKVDIWTCITETEHANRKSGRKNETSELIQNLMF